ncbi:MAG: dihydrodipicolinate synthase family protein [Clostridia bacterium]|nr:dihydrodipicolinate synthase family protein [Clostridia bacterium]
MLKQIPNGVYPTMITPYTADNKIDYNAVEQLLAWYAERNVAGVFAICQSSEIFFLSFEERLALLKFIMAHKPADMTVVASGNVERDLDKQIEEAKAFIDTGIDAYVFISNRLADETQSDDALWRSMETAAEKLPDIGLGVYECPYPYKRVLTPAVMKRMADSGRFQFLKDTCCDLTQIRAKLDAVKGSALKIFNANAATLLESLKMGCAGYSGVMANFHPEIYAELCNIYSTDPVRAEQLQDFVGFFSVAECQCYPVNAKYYLQLEGLDINIDSRARNKAEFTPNRQMEIQQMRELTKVFKTL